MTVQISTLAHSEDTRGFSFAAPSEALVFLGHIADLRCTSTTPGAVRGNHYHLHKRQALVMFPGTVWSLHWDEGEDTPAQHRNFPGNSAVMVLVRPGCSIAVRNDGEHLLWLVTCSSKPYDPKEIIAREVI